MEEVLRIEHLSKGFPGVQALDDVFLTLYKGECHAIVGENGAGKSTMMKILSGISAPDSGTVTVKGRTVAVFTPKEAAANGIAMIHQELIPIPDMTVSENVYLGREPTFGPLRLVDSRKRNADTAKLLARFHLDIAPNRKMRTLSMAEMQLVEILKAISQNAEILIMDEPTSALTDEEVENLKSIILELKSSGISILYISHRMEEIFSICDRITVLRDGVYIGTKPIQEVTGDSVIAMMVGREISQIYPAKPDVSGGETVLSVKDLSDGRHFSGISFTARRGEVLGIAGLMGAGRTELVETIFGVRQKAEGTVAIDGRPVSIRSPRDAIAHGIALIPEDRKLTGLNLLASVKDNLALPNLDALAPWGIVRRSAEAEAADGQIKALRIKTPSRNQCVNSLSGGNQQKVVVGKWLLHQPDIIILDEPTRGIDVGAKAEIYSLIRTLAGQGKTILMVSSELPEVIGMCDRVMVLCEGRKTGELSGEDITQEAIMAYATLNQ